MVRKARTTFRRRGAFQPTIVTLAMAFDEQTSDGEEFVIPENLAELSDEQLQELHTQATENFDALYGDGTGLTDEEFNALAALTEGIEALSGEIEGRETAQAERAEQAAALAARVRGNADEASTDDEGDEGAADADAEAGAEGAEGEQAQVAASSTADESLAASATAPAPRREVRVPLSSVGRRRPAERQRAAASEEGIRQYMVASGEGLGVASGEGVDFAEVGEMLNRRLGTFNATRYDSAAKKAQHISEQHSLITINRPIPDELNITSNDPDHVREVFDRAGDESRLPGQSLVAAGGWCAPSQVLYDLIGEDESRDGLLSLPEVGAPRGGISFTTGPDFRDIYNEIVGFSFTEEQDVDGEYAYGSAPAWAAAAALAAGVFRTLPDGAIVVALDAGTTGATAPTSPPTIGGTVVDNPGASSITWQRVVGATPLVEGSKPCYHVSCPPFEEYRLDVDGLCITAGLLQSKGYPEVLARTTRGALVAHDHRINGKMIAQMAAGSTGITLPATQAGTAAPVLTAIELQVEHYRYSRRLSRTATLEAVFPFWIRGAIRSDLSRRLGVDMISIPNARIDEWFRERGIAPQFVYNWQNIDTQLASAFNAWPTTVSFLLYSAGTWIRGASDVITLDTIYDSVMLGTNDYTALFTEEAWFVAKRGQDSRLVTTSLTADGAAHIGVEIAHNGTTA